MTDETNTFGRGREKVETVKGETLPNATKVENRFAQLNMADRWSKIKFSGQGKRGEDGHVNIVVQDPRDDNDLVTRVGETYGAKSPHIITVDNLDKDTPRHDEKLFTLECLDDTLDDEEVTVELVNSPKRLFSLVTDKSWRRR